MPHSIETRWLLLLLLLSPQSNAAHTWSTGARPMQAMQHPSLGQQSRALGSSVACGASCLARGHSQQCLTTRIAVLCGHGKDPAGLLTKHELTVWVKFYTTSPECPCRWGLEALAGWHGCHWVGATQEAHARGHHGDHAHLAIVWLACTGSPPLGPTQRLRLARFPMLVTLGALGSRPTCELMFGVRLCNNRFGHKRRPTTWELT